MRQSMDRCCCFCSGALFVTVTCRCSCCFVLACLAYSAAVDAVTATPFFYGVFLRACRVVVVRLRPTRVVRPCRGRGCLCSHMGCFVPSLTFFLLLPCESFSGEYARCIARLGGCHPLPQAAAANMRDCLLNRMKLRFYSRSVKYVAAVDVTFFSCISLSF